MVSTPGGGGVTNVSDGWLFYNGEMVQFPAQSYPPVGAGNDMYVVITPSATPLNFNDGSTPNVVLDKTGVLNELINSTTTDATHFLLSAMVSFGTGLGLNNRETAWSSLPVSTLPTDGGVTGIIYYKKDFAAKTLRLRGSLAANNAQNFHASPVAIYSLMATLPPGYTPMYDAFFIANFFASGLIKDDLGIAWVKQINCVINTGGQILFNWIKPDAAILAYGVDFNVMISLD